MASVTDIGVQVTGRGLFSPLPYCSHGMMALFRAMQKGGCGSITLDELSQCLDRAVEIGAEIRKIIG